MCCFCRDIASAREVAKFLRIEAKLIASTAKMYTAIVGDDEDNKDDDVEKKPKKIMNLPKNSFETIKSDLQECLSHLGKHHWLYLDCVRIMIAFYVKLASSSQSGGNTVTTALETAVRWALKFIAASEEEHLGLASVHAASAVVGFAFDPAMALLERCPNSPWRIHAALLVKMSLDIDRGGFTRQLSEETLDIAGKALDIFVATDSKTTATLRPPSTALEAVCRASEMDEADDGALVAAWENHLADRVAALMKSRAPGAAQLRSQLNLPAPSAASQP